MISTSFRPPRGVPVRNDPGAGVNVIPARLQAGQHDHLLAMVGERLEDG